MQEQQAAKPVSARRKLLINKKFQLRFLAFVSITAITACAILYGACLYFFSQYRGYAVDVGFRPSHPIFEVLSNMEQMLLGTFAMTAATVIVFTLFAGLIFSNRVAGPMYRLRIHFEKVARGETLGDVSFRTNDFFAEVAEAYNKQQEYVRSRLKETK